MNHSTLQFSDAETSKNPLEIRESLQVLDRRNWLHWWNTILVIMLLTGAIAALSLPKILSDKDLSFQLQIQTAVRGLFGTVLIFNLYMFYQQRVLGRLRTNLSSQMEVAAEQRARAEVSREIGILDPLTGLYNQRFSDGRLRNEVARAEKSGYPLVLLLLDLDNFSGINERYGNSAGDLALKEFALRLGRSTRGSDLAFRLGGDEFLVVLVDCPSENVGIVSSRIGGFEVETGLHKIPVSCSQGWAQYEPGETSEDLIRRAYGALQANKASHLESVPQL